MNLLKFRSIFYGFLAGISLFAFYIIILTLAQDFLHAKEQLKRDIEFVIPIVLAFGIQIGLYLYLRGLIKIQGYQKEHNGSTATAVVSGGTSTVSMVACCAHHLTDVLPVIGLSAATIFLAKYRSLFLIIAILSNMWGIVYISTKIWLFKNQILNS